MRKSHKIEHEELVKIPPIPNIGVCEPPLVLTELLSRDPVSYKTADDRFCPPPFLSLDIKKQRVPTRLLQMAKHYIIYLTHNNKIIIDTKEIIPYGNSDQ